MNSAPRSRPIRSIAPTSKLTDANNAEQPQLSFQREAVQAFRTRLAQDVPNVPAPPADTTDTTTNPITSSPKRCADAGSIDNDNQSKPSMFAIWLVKSHSLMRDSHYSQKAPHYT